MKLIYRFESKKVWEEENARPLLVVEKPYTMLSDLCHALPTRHLARLAVAEVTKVVTGQKRKCWVGTDQCLLEIYKHTTAIHYQLGLKKKSIDTPSVLQLLQDWGIYLKSVK
jgi:hypothetical protein